ncbi:MAG: AlpA family transcriptional regulator [Betaproteobacteria bacterium]|nr:AlpA family transcriptional regulator [Betaproteobacteria bacterium]
MLARTGLSKSTICSLARENKFKAPIKTGEKAAGWKAMLKHS